MDALKDNLGEFDKLALIPIGEKVITLCPIIKGIVCGYGFIHNRTVYLMELNKGEYTESKTAYIRTIIVAQDNLKKELA